jgi:hypothetical protein
MESLTFSTEPWSQEADIDPIGGKPSMSLPASWTEFLAVSPEPRLQEVDAGPIGGTFRRHFPSVCWTSLMTSVQISILSVRNLSLCQPHVKDLPLIHNFPLVCLPAYPTIIPSAPCPSAVRVLRFSADVIDDSVSHGHDLHFA